MKIDMLLLILADETHLVITIRIIIHIKSYDCIGILIVGIKCAINYGRAKFDILCNIFANTINKRKLID